MGRPRAVIALWLLPALCFLAAFLIVPMALTLARSFRSTLRVSENDILAALRQELSSLARREVESRETLSLIPRWENGVKAVAVRFSFPAPLLSPELDVREASEALWLEATRAPDQARVHHGFGQYRRLAHDPAIRKALLNNALWLVLFTTSCMALGLLFAYLFEHTRWGGVARTLVFMPMALSFVAAGIIWSFMYEKSPEVGTLNALLGALLPSGKWEPLAFLGNPRTVNFGLIAAGIWMWTGFAAVLFQNALRAVPHSLLEAAALDGASRRQIFWHIEIPFILPTVLVVGATLTVNVLKVFDLVYTMTGGGPYSSSEVLANRMYMVAFQEGDSSYAAAIAVVLLLVVLPLVLANLALWLRRARDEGSS